LVRYPRAERLFLIEAQIGQGKRLLRALREEVVEEIEDDEIQREIFYVPRTFYLTDRTIEV